MNDRFIVQLKINGILYQENISVLFVINSSRTNQKGLCPLHCRITLNKKRKQFATGLFVNPHFWGNKLQLVSTQEGNHKYINAQIERIRVKLYNIALVFQLKGTDYSLENIY